MEVFCIKDERGWFMRSQDVPPISGVPEGDEDALALMVYLSEEDALADAPEDSDGSIVVMDAATVTGALEEGRIAYVRIFWGGEGDAREDTVTALPGWRRLVEELERLVEEAKEAKINKFIGELLESGELAYDIETDKLYRPE